MLDTYEECVAALKQFDANFPQIAFSQNTLGYEIQQLEGDPVLVVRVRKKLPIRDVRDDERIPDKLEIQVAGRKIELQTKIVEDEIDIANEANVEHAVSDVRAGDTAAGIDLAGFGTAGWTVELNGTLVCVSNWHVLCGLGNETPIGRSVLLKSQVLAGLHAFQPIHFGSGANSWDYALASYLDPNDALAEMRQCEDGSSNEYPLSLSANLGFGETFTKVGARRPTCRQGKLTAIGNSWVKYPGRGEAFFNGQLIFSKMTDPGDSGCIIVRKSDRSVSGLNFAGSSTRTVANPLYLIGWQKIGEAEYFDIGKVPMFRSSDTPSAIGIYGGTENYTIQNIPKFASRRVFVGVAVGVGTAGTGGLVPGASNTGSLGARFERSLRYMKWSVPPPAPSAGRDSVEKVVVDRKDLGDSEARIVMLCFELIE